MVKSRLSSLHTGVAKDDYYTPPHVFERLGLHFDLDVCAPPGGVAWLPAATHYSLNDDGLLQPWHGRVWMNPPFSNPTPWMRKFIEHGNGVCIIPVSRGRWFTEAWDALDAMTVCPHGFSFIEPTGQKKQIFMPTFFGAIGSSNAAALLNFGSRAR